MQWSKKFFGLDLFKDVDEDAVAALAGRMVTVSLQANAQVTDPDVATHQTYIVLSGLCLSALTSASGKEVAVEQIVPGQTFCNPSALDGRERVRSVRTLEPTEVARIETARLNAWLEENPTALRRMLAASFDRKQVLIDRLFDMAVHDVETRVRRFLEQMLRSNGALHNGGVLDPAPSHGAIAAHVGANREAVSRTISRLNRRGVIISGRRRIVVLHAGSLPPSE